MRRFNWPIWAGFVLSVFAFISYPFVFARWSMTRDFPWANLLLFGIAAILLLIGFRRAFASGHTHPKRRKIAASLLATLSALVLGLFVFSTFIMACWLPASHGAPQIGQKTPEFLLADTNNKSVTLATLLSSPINGQAPKGALLIFYRGYW
ncbi:MAG: hypothetical protein H0U60_03585 [Blastocatellia bacterium]|nr:hypothetical protein [Blastocatellia bacterium]